MVSNAMLCFNCFAVGHQANQCRYGSCHKCGRKRNTRLHDDNKIAESPREQPPNVSVMYAQNCSVNCMQYSTTSMLATAVIFIRNKTGILQPCRAIVDSSAQLNFITVSCAKRLQLDSANETVPISGIGSNSMISKRLMPTIISSRGSSYSSSATFYSLPTISSNLPSQHINTNQVSIPEHILNDLADPDFHVTSPIDCLLGSGVFYDIFDGERVTINEHLIAHKTKLGWVITGELFDSTNHNFTSTCVMSNKSALALFSTKANERNREEQAAEDHFTSTFQQDESGRFIVRLPLGQDSSVLGDSRFMAQKRFFNLERRFAKDKVLEAEYKAFMQEYLSMGHMQLTTTECHAPTYYLPHHAVVKNSSITTKVRVVFDGSAPARSGLSLNDILLRGAKVHPDIISIILRFRLHTVAITADVTKMYRQVLLHEDDRNLHRML